MKNTNKDFASALKLLASFGFIGTSALTIIKRVNTHIAYCIEHNQNFEETLDFVQQDFNMDISNIATYLMASDKKTEAYFMAA